MTENFDAFEQKLYEALQGDEMPSADFAARVMTQVRQTPQEKAAPQRNRTPKMKLWQMAACAAVVVLAIPFLRLTTMRAGSAAPKAAADCAAECSEEECYVVDEQAPAEGGTVNDSMDSGEDKQKDAAEPVINTAANEQQQTVTVSGELADAAFAWLQEMGYADDGGYVLSAEEAARLNEAVPGIELPLCTVQLILEVG